jgi:flagellar motor switch protein FliG
MATLNFLKEMTDIQIQNWLRKVGQENAAKLSVVMLDADDEARGLIYKNMSSRAVILLKDDLERFKKTPFDEQTITGYAIELEKLIDAGK